ncbi:methyltransferase domain-containing protein [Brevundimonas sp. LF-1]|uniref:class I SAM-dependent methyltransferase n=1 Tax=Brevundimonas sp. LF-1 TaxID=3126100 RepID=UPI0030DE8378
MRRTAATCWGWATPPWLDAFIGARRVIAAMPGAQGAEQWTAGGRNRTVLIDERRLPFAAGTFDRILLVHALEEADDPKALLTEAVRALAPSGRVILAAAARGGLWARAEATPSATAAPSPAASWSGWCAKSASSRSPGPRRFTSPVAASAGSGRRAGAGGPETVSRRSGPDHAGSHAPGLRPRPPARPGPDGAGRTARPDPLARRP